MPALFFDSAFLMHETGPHPESPERLTAVMRALESSPAYPAEGPRACPPVEEPDLLRVHERSYVEAVRGVSARGGGMLDPDTVVSAGSWEAALRAAGAGVAAVEGAVRGEFASAFCAVRPPGHHALPARGTGFCVFNNVAIAAAHARAALGFERVLIVDWDVHHGNGTQAVFESDPAVFYLSLHLWPHYPGTGAAAERGRGAAEGTVLNVPLPAGTGHDRFLEALDRALDEGPSGFGAGLVLVSSGFDAAAGDPLGGLGLLPETYAEATRRVAALGAPVVSLLEGGYDLRSLAECARAHFESLP
jgi:acetoin utilization deacetylase AcuC-like enzyme